MRSLFSTALGCWLCYSHTHAQNIVHVSQVLPFATQGAVASLGRGVAAPPSATSSTGTTETKITATVSPSPAAEGGRIVTGANGASSLLLGSSGTARMGADSDVKVPEPAEKTHSLELLKGKILLNIRGEELKKRGSDEFRLKTPATLLAVKGTKFFTVSADGTDTIGVHEGSVTVTEPTSGKSVTLEAGNSVTASPGSLSEIRAMTDEEKGYVPEYAAADLVSAPVPFAIKQPVPTGKRLQILLFQNGKAAVLGEESSDRVHYGTILDPKLGPCLDWRVLKSGRNSVPVSPQLLQDGSIRYAWTAREPGAAYQCYFDYGGHSGLNYADENYSRLNRLVKTPSNTAQPQGKLVALQFRVRATNIASAYLVPSAAAGFNSGYRFNLSSSFTNAAGWTDVLVPALQSRTGEMLLPFSHLLINGANYKQSVPAAKIIAFELADFVLLTTPP